YGRGSGQPPVVPPAGDARAGDATLRAGWARMAATIGGRRDACLREDSGHAVLTVGCARHRCSERARRTRPHLAGAGHGPDQRRQRHFPLPVQSRLERLARAAVVPVRGGVPRVRRVHAAAQRPHPHRRDLRAPVAAHADLDRFPGHVVLPVADVALPAVAVLGAVRERLGHGRDLEQPRRAGPLAGAADDPGRLPAAEPAGRIGADQTHRPAGAAAGAARAPRERRHRDRARGRSGPLIAFLIENMAPVIFAALAVFLLLGYPVAFALGALGLIFGVLGVELGLLPPALFQALPERIFGIMANETLLAVPFFTFMGLILERSG